MSPRLMRASLQSCRRLCVTKSAATPADVEVVNSRVLCGASLYKPKDGVTLWQDNLVV